VPVRATRSGRVVSARGSWGSAYGLHVVIQGPLHIIEMGYAHLSSVSVVDGQLVRRGDVIGHSGNSGNTTGPHLHYEERRPPWRYSDNRRPRANR
jgi:murein DD-endopeptidase MepM/ murein hydrolase activator NlpD